MRTKNRTEETIKELLSRTLGVRKKELTSEASFESDLNIGPAELREAISKVFEKFAIETESAHGTQKEPGFKTVGELIDFVKDHLDEIEE